MAAMKLSVSRSKTAWNLAAPASVNWTSMTTGPTPSPSARAPVEVAAEGAVDVAVDAAGDVVWYHRTDEAALLAIRLQNGNLLYNTSPGGARGALVEIDLLQSLGGLLTQSNGGAR